MLRELRLSGLGVIEQAEVTLPPGMTVITGETGAGKTMLLSALALLAGARADSAVVRGERAQVSAIFGLPRGHPVAGVAAEAGAAIEDDELIAARQLTASGRSRAHLGGVPVPSSVLGSTVGQLIAVHGQSDQLRLRSAAQQRELVDAYGGVDLSDYQALYDAAASARQRLERLQDQDRQSAFEADSLRRAVKEIDAVAPAAGEEVELPAQIERLANAEDLRQAAEQSLAALNGDESALNGGGSGLNGSASGLGGGATVALEAVRRALAGAAARDPALAALADRAGELAYLASDLAAEVAEYRLGLEADPAAMAALQERRAGLNGLLRKYGATAAEVIAFAAQARERLGELDLSPERRQALALEADRLAEERDRAAAEVSATRREAGQRLAGAVSAELAGLGMKGARFEIEVSALPEPARHGADGIEFRFASHGAGPLRPLAKGASGGELSRLMLALEVAALGAAAGASADSGEGRDGEERAGALTLVFDEVDQGVGGAAALALAERLAKLARGHQVLVVTHLPQIAAAADHHLVVAKDGATTTVGAVSGEGRQRELARMLAGLDRSGAALEHAAELLARDWVGQSSTT
ncbi:MAG: DNA repair protein RecN [Bifidobacteriaceae bacterium]|jgi:DNA repair protein RecN (Recombination protein N)|nr:DNA repair protein RecN [Bifidobacteriaceae bacterium]